MTPAETIRISSIERRGPDWNPETDAAGVLNIDVEATCVFFPI